LHEAGRAKRLAKPATGYLLGVPKGQVYWKWEDQGEAGDPVGPVLVTAPAPEGQQAETVEWDRWASRSEAAEFAREQGYEFFADE
jgi:hypothetical protein